MESQEVCEHLSHLTEIRQPQKHVCEECIKTGSQWVHLRTCQTCGVTLCCNSSPNQHMTKHYHLTAHPVVSSAERGEKWVYCYKDDMMAEY